MGGGEEGVVGMVVFVDWKLKISSFEKNYQFNEGPKI